MRIGKKRGPVMILFPSFITLGIYYIYWVYRTSSEIQEYLGEADIPPIVEMLLTFFTGGLYLFYWDWKTARQIARMQSRLGLNVQDNSLLYLVFNILGAGPIYGLGMLNIAIQQIHLNEIWDQARVRTYA